MNNDLDKKIPWAKPDYIRYLDEIYAGYAAAIGKDTLSDNEKRQAIVSYILSHPESWPQFTLIE